MEKIWTIGHSTRTIEEFIDVLRSVGIELVADVRLLPGSKRHPQFNRSELDRSLHDAGMNYMHFPELGGRRKPRADSPNTAWRNESFRGYADHMETEEFRCGIERLYKLADRKIALMCAEAVWWKCHRALIADYLKSRGVEIDHILGRGKTELHPFTSAARLIEGKLSYSAPQDELSI
ncbi:MAG TPA: DUF488 domain-containing protein [Chthoniobacterales bacterium]